MLVSRAAGRGPLGWGEVEASFHLTNPGARGRGDEEAGTRLTVLLLLQSLLQQEVAPPSIRNKASLWRTSSPQRSKMPPPWTSFIHMHSLRIAISQQAQVAPLATDTALLVSTEYRPRVRLLPRVDEDAAGL